MTETLVSAWQAARRALEAAQIEEPTIDARLLVEAGAGVARLDILTDPRRVLSAAQIAAIDALVARRVAREPVSQILGVKGFRDLLLEVTRDVLTPRPETELLVHLALAAIPEDAPARVLDLGVGSGAILAAILSERPQTLGLGVDASEAALSVAQRNIDKLGLSDRATLQRGDWGRGLSGAYDVIVSNPPYVASRDVPGLAPEIALYEPHLALDGGEDGLDAYRALMQDVARLLAPQGVAILEIGSDQAAEVRQIVEEAGLRPVALYKDLAGLPRVWTAQA